MSSWNDVTKKVREIRKNFVVRCAISFVAVLASALLQSYVILAFIRRQAFCPADLRDLRF